MGECGLRGGYTEILNIDPAVKALYLKSISAKLCPTGTFISFLMLNQFLLTWVTPSLNLKITGVKRNNFFQNPISY